MTREELHQEIRSGVIRSCYLLEGEEEYTKHAAAMSLRDAVIRGEFAQLNESVLVDPTAQELIACAETLPLMADKRFVLVKDSSLFSGRGGKEEEDQPFLEGKGDDADRIAQYLSQLPNTVCVVFWQKGKVNRTRKAFKQIAKLGGHVSFDPLDQRTKVKWIARELKRFGKAIEYQTAEQLLFAVGDDMFLLFNELQKLAAWAGEDEQIRPEGIESVCSKSSEYRVFDLSDALATGQSRRTARLMDEMLREGEQRLMLLALLQRQYRQLLFTRFLADTRLPADAVASKLGVPPFVARKLLGTVRRYSTSMLEQAYSILVDTEFQVKSGLIAEEGCLEQAVYRILALQEEQADAG